MILDEIVAHKKLELESAKRATPLAALKERMARARIPRGFEHALTQPKDISLIAEIKKASPSAGVIRNGFDPVEIGRIYERSGAAAISVLTDEHFFGGHLASLDKVRSAVTVPVLRKDFIIDEYQLYESSAFGADAVLLIVAILSDQELKDFLALLNELGMGALVEVHTHQERDRALGAGARIIGINNRDLRTFEVDLATTMQLASDLPQGIPCVSESGIKTHEDIQRLREAGVDAALIGTAFMAAEDISAKIEELFH